MSRKNNRQTHEGEAVAKKPSRKVQAINIGIYSLRHKIIAPDDSPVNLFQAELGKRLGGYYNGKGFTPSSMGVTVAGISEYPDALFRRRRPGDEPLTSQIICKLLLDDYGLGGQPIDLETSELGLFSKNRGARWMSLGIVFTEKSASVITQEQDAINDILGTRGYPGLKKFGGVASRPHVSIGTIDSWTISDTEPATLEKILPFRIPGLLHFGGLAEISPPKPDEGPKPATMPENDALLAGPYIPGPRYDN